jgi:hypothetical protein
VSGGIDTRQGAVQENFNDIAEVGGEIQLGHLFGGPEQQAFM